MMIASTSSHPSPFTRDRTNLFLSYRASSIRSSPYSSSVVNGKGKGRAHTYEDEEGMEERKGLMEQDEMIDLERGNAPALPPQWVDIGEQVDSILDGIKPKIAQLDKLHAKHVLPGFTDRSAEERDINNLTNDITKDFRTMQRLIRQIAEMSKSLLSGSKKVNAGQGPEAKRLNMIMLANVQSGLAAKVQEWSGIFRTKQTNYLRQLKGFEDRRGSFVERPPFVIDDEDDETTVSSFQNQTQSHLAPSTTALDQRSNEISSIAQSITDLSDLFADLSSLVIDQGTLLDRVDWNVEQMGVEVKGAAEELSRATASQKRSGKCQLIFLLLLLIAAAAIFITFKPRRNAAVPVLPPSDSEVNTGFGVEQIKAAALATSSQRADDVVAAMPRTRNRSGQDLDGGNARGITRFVDGYRGPAVVQRRGEGQKKRRFVIEKWQ